MVTNDVFEKITGLPVYCKFVFAWYMVLALSPIMEKQIITFVNNSFYDKNSLYVGLLSAKFTIANLL